MLSIQPLNIDNIHFEQMGHRIYPVELQLNTANASDIEEYFLNLNLSIHNDAVSTNIMIYWMILILILLIFHFLMAMSLDVPLMVYEGDSICNKIVPINSKVLYLFALQLHSQKGLLPGYTTAKSQLSSLFTILHNPLSGRGTKLHCDTNLSSDFKFRILYELSLFSVCLFVL